MRNKFVLVLMAVAACGGDSPTGLQKFGDIKGEVIAGGSQRSTAAANRAGQRVTYRVYREQVSLMASGSTANASANIKLQPNASACVGEDQVDLVPFTRCVTTDSTGQSRFDFPKLPTKAGRYVAKLNATYGLEATTFDSVVVIVDAALPDSQWIMDAIAARTSPAVFVATHVVDKFGNPVPYRLTADSSLTPADTALGSAGARTVSFTDSRADGIWRTIPVTGASGAIARMSYRLVKDPAGARINAVICGLGVNPCVSTTWK